MVAKFPSCTSAKFWLFLNICAMLNKLLFWQITKYMGFSLDVSIVIISCSAIWLDCKIFAKRKAYGSPFPEHVCLQWQEINAMVIKQWHVPHFVHLCSGNDHASGAWWCASWTEEWSIGVGLYRRGRFKRRLSTQRWLKELPWSNADLQPPPSRPIPR